MLACAKGMKNHQSPNRRSRRSTLVDYWSTPTLGLLLNPTRNPATYSFKSTIVLDTIKAIFNLIQHLLIFARSTKQRCRCQQNLAGLTGWNARLERSSCKICARVGHFINGTTLRQNIFSPGTRSFLHLRTSSFLNSRLV
jgi:hypothetical protein